MALRPALAITMCLICLAPMFAAEPTDKSTTGAEIRLAETEPSDELIEAEVVGTDGKIYLHKTSRGHERGHRGGQCDIGCPRQTSHRVRLY